MIIYGPMENPRNIKTEVVVIGGGVTGCGVARDLAMRGVDVCLVEQHDLAYGATGRCHGLLHSGVRYAVKDPEAAGECIRENRILCKIAPECIENTGGIVVGLPGDDPQYRLDLIRNCQEIGIETQEISSEEALDIEPFLNPELESALLVPDAAVDPFLLSLENLRDAERYDARSFLHTSITGFHMDRGRLKRVLAEDDNGPLEFQCEMAIIAAGGWSGKIASLANARIPLELSKGSLIVMNRRFTQRVVNRCRLPADADLIIPNGPTSIIGTTSITVPFADGLSIEPEEIDVMFKEGDLLVPGFHGARALRAYAGVRPLFSGGENTMGRDISRGFVVLDHEKIEGVKGLVSIVGGKLTTYRLMAEKTSDLVAAKLGNTNTCRTADKALYEGENLQFYSRAGRLKRIAGRVPGHMFCECELVAKEDLLEIMPELKGRADLTDLQHRTRLGMGPCQGGFCSFRAIGLMHQQGMFDEKSSVGELRKFLARRFKGILPVLWEDQWREEQLNYGLYATLFNLDRSGE